jgi:hypothetical protein
MEFQKIQVIHLLIWILIKADNPACIMLTEASVELQHSEIYYSTDASNKWLQRSTDEYRSGKSDMHEITKDFMKLGHRLTYLNK